MLCFPNLIKKTHMPFIVEHMGKQILLFSYSHGKKDSYWGEFNTPVTYEPWQLGWSDWLDENDPIHPLDVGLSPDSVNCNIVATSMNDWLVITFISSSNTGKDYFLMQTQGNDFTHLSHARKINPVAIWSGFAKENISCLVPRTRDRIILNKKDLIIPQLPIVLRAVPVDQNILISGLENGKTKSILLNASGQPIGEIQQGENNVYKSHIFKQDLVFAEKMGSFEDRVLKWGNYKMIEF